MKQNRSRFEDRLRILYNIVIALLVVHFTSLATILLCLGFRGGVGPVRKTEKEDGGQRAGANGSLGRTRNFGVHLERVSAIILSTVCFHLSEHGEMDI